MRVIHVEQYFKTRDVPGGSRAFEMARRLVQRGHQVDFITTRMEREGRPGWQTAEVEGIRVHSCPIPYSNRLSYRERMLSFVKFAWLAANYGRRLAADVVFASSTPLTVAIPAVRIRKAMRVPMVFEVRDLWPEVPIALGVLRSPFLRVAARWLERYAYRHSARLVALSPGMKEGVCRTGYPEARVSVIPNSCDVDLFRVPSEVGADWRASQPEIGNRPLVLYAGTLGRVNGVAWLAKLAGQCLQLDPEVCFAVIGDGVEREHVRAVARECDVLGRNLFLFPAVAKSQIPAAFSAASMTTSVVIDRPELWHNSANKVFDSFAAGRPVVINHQGWQADLLKESGAGLALPVSDLPASARILVQHLRDARWLERASRAAARLADQRFGRDQLAGELEAVLKAAVAG